MANSTIHLVAQNRPSPEEYPVVERASADTDVLTRLRSRFATPQSTEGGESRIGATSLHVTFLSRAVVLQAIGAALLAGNRDIAGIGSPQDLADVDFAIVRASFAVAETGSLLLSEADLRVNAVAYLAQHLIVLLDPADILANLHHAYRRPEFRGNHYCCFHTGPSATADIEGVLIHGAQGVRSLSVLPIARTA